jgi:hypothetical protein
MPGRFRQENAVPEAVVDDVGALVGVQRGLAPQDRERVYAGLDEWPNWPAAEWRSEGGGRSV